MEEKQYFHGNIFNSFLRLRSDGNGLPTYIIGCLAIRYTADVTGGKPIAV
jgi:hypothetical protein